MNKVLKILAFLVLFLTTGCMNLYIRCPGTSSKINTVYQSTQTAAALSYVIMFPQIISWRGTEMQSSRSSDITLVPENIITIPIGLLGFCDTACEAVLDTILLPIDWTLSEYRNKKWDNQLNELQSSNQKIVQE